MVYIHGDSLSMYTCSIHMECIPPWMGEITIIWASEPYLQNWRKSCCLSHWIIAEIKYYNAWKISCKVYVTCYSINVILNCIIAGIIIKENYTNIKTTVNQINEQMNGCPSHTWLEGEPFKFDFKRFSLNHKTTERLGKRKVGVILILSY
jgi:hypothetical protein